VKRRFLLPPADGIDHYRYVLDLDAAAGGVVMTRSSPSIAARLRPQMVSARAAPLSLKKVIVIDAGHGGHDPGAQVKGLSESELTLDVALRLEKLLLRKPGVEVIQTRRTNAFVPLEERTEIANRSGADIFLSIHANASADGRARGVETYFLNFAPSAEAETIAAARTPSARRCVSSPTCCAPSLSSKLDGSRDPRPDGAAVALAQVSKSDRKARNLGVKQAPFMVLVGAAMPTSSRISFLTNQRDAGLLYGSTPADHRRCSPASPATAVAQKATDVATH
jgi:N-acetylmuramoyl-L-alanine amidase